MDDMSSAEQERRERLERWSAEIREKAELQPDFALQPSAAEHVMEKYSDTLKRLADS
jgi:hypothetical protein